MRVEDFKNYLKTLFPEYRFMMGFQDKTIKKLIILYQRNGTRGLFYVGSNPEENTKILPITITVSIGDSYVEAEKEAARIFDTITVKNNVKYNDFVFSVMTKSGMLPVYLGRNEEGNYEFALDIDVYYN